MKRQSNYLTFYYLRKVWAQPITWIVLLTTHIYMLYNLMTNLTLDKIYQTNLSGIEIVLLTFDDYVVTFGVCIGFLLVLFSIHRENRYENFIIYRLNNRFILYQAYLLALLIISVTYTTVVFSLLVIVALFKKGFQWEWSNDLFQITHLIESGVELHPFLLFFASSTSNLEQFNPLEVLIGIYLLTNLLLFLISLIYHILSNKLSNIVSIIIIIFYVMLYRTIPIEIYSQYKELFFQVHIIPSFKVAEDLLNVSFMTSFLLLAIGVLILIIIGWFELRRKDL